MTHDFIVQDEGSIILLRPETVDAQDWANDHFPKDAQWFGNAVAIERRYFESIEQGIYNDGLSLEFV